MDDKWRNTNDEIIKWEWQQGQWKLNDSPKKSNIYQKEAWS